MPTPPTFTPIENGEEQRPEITREPGGYRGVRHGWIDTGDITLALLSAVGLPAYGASWDSLAPNLVVVRQTVSIWSGEKSLARLDYATPGLGGGVLEYPAKPGKPVSVAVPSTSSVTARRFLLKESAPGSGTFVPAATTDPLIAQGMGVPREIGLLDNRVKVAYSLSNLAAVPWARIRSLHSTQARNSDAVSLPNFFGSGYPKPAGIGTLRYRMAEYETDGDLFVVTHVMAEADDHVVEYEDIDEDGNVQLPNKRGHIYPEATFAGLW